MAFTLAPFLLLSSLLGGCDMLVSDEGTGGADKASKAPGKEKKKKEGEVDETEEALADDDVYHYNPIGKRDPFRSFLSGVGTGSVLDDAPRTPLQRFDIDQFLLVGIVWGIERPRALVEDPTGVGHIMEIGTYIGKNWGKVTQIDADAVVVTEEYQTIDGELVVNPIRMVLPESEKDK